MENIIKNPGLQHITENIFWNLGHQNLENCRQINQSCKEILDNPLFWLGKLISRGISKKNQMEWIKAIEMTKGDRDLEKFVFLYLKRSMKNSRVADLNCYIDEDFLIKSANMIRMYLKAENLNEQDEDGRTPIHLAVAEKDLERVKVLSQLTDNPNVPDKVGDTPIQLAACNGYGEIVRILAPLTDNPNAPNNNGLTPIQMATIGGHTEIVRILAPLTDNPNAPNHDGLTPIFIASCDGHTEIVRILAPLTENPNSPSNILGTSPLEMASEMGHVEIVNLLTSSMNLAKRPRLDD